MRIVTSVAVKEARRAEISKEMLRSRELKVNIYIYFSFLCLHYSVFTIYNLCASDAFQFY